AELPERLEEALSALGLHTAIPCTAEDYAAAVGLDKKGAGEDISVILLERMGRAVPHRMPKSRLLEELRCTSPSPPPPWAAPSPRRPPSPRPTG
ncbi:hypothetical protein NE659_27430, partial [Flavonifractor plautii]|nr:hypothetical protein [Flavonifractor plautii]